MRLVKAFFILAPILSLGPCPKPNIESCLIGGTPKAPCKGTNCPPCWIQHDGKNWACYVKSKTPGGPAKCPNWKGIVDITAPPSSCATSRKSASKPAPAKQTLPIKPAPTKPTLPIKPASPIKVATPKTPTPKASAGFTICPDITFDTCFRGRHLQYPCKGFNCPPCWEYKVHQWDCFDPVDGRCEWDTLVDIRNLPANCVLPECP
ncbi:hypothetical protein DSO57_1002537 [Entomophthora muscae]|uniref:Uncharacterized protein n=1 Tax=Entomophthora muscae TaxID=34485 RepID=A0ACC2T9E3_9FUNG|nr:hypothetical protein DSO57_1002537 [Entomophthora muscae]